MKEHITLQRLMQEGWIPIMTGILSVGAIISLECSISLVYAAVFPVIALFLGAIAAKHVMQQTLQQTGNVKSIKGLVDQYGNIIPLLSRQAGLIKNHTGQAITSLINRVTCLAAWTEAMLSAFAGSENHEGIVGQLFYSPIETIHAGHFSRSIAMAAYEIRRRIFEKAEKIKIAIHTSLQVCADCTQENEK